MKRKYGAEQKKKRKEREKTNNRETEGVRVDEMGGGGWQEGSMQIAQDLTGIFLDR